MSLLEGFRKTPELNDSFIALLSTLGEPNQVAGRISLKNAVGSTLKRLKPSTGVGLQPILVTAEQSPNGCSDQLQKVVARQVHTTTLLHQLRFLGLRPSFPRRQESRLSLRAQSLQSMRGILINRRIDCSVLRLRAG